MHESQVYLLTCATIEESCKTSDFLTTYNHEENVQSWNSMQQLLHIVAICGTVCNNIVTMRTANGDAM